VGSIASRRFRSEAATREPAQSPHGINLVISTLYPAPAPEVSGKAKRAGKILIDFISL
jgi:hypothetical protein